MMTYLHPLTRGNTIALCCQKQPALMRYEKVLFVFIYALLRVKS